MNQRLNLVGATLLVGCALSQLSSPAPTLASTYTPASTSSDSGWGWDDWGDWASTATWWPWDWPDWIPGASDQTSSATEASTTSSTFGAGFTLTGILGETATSSEVDEPTTFPTPDVPIPEIPFSTSSGLYSAAGSWEAAGATGASGNPAFGPASDSSSFPGFTDTPSSSSTFSEPWVPGTTEDSWPFPWDTTFSIPSPSSLGIPDSSNVPDSSFTEVPFTSVSDISSAGSDAVSGTLLPSFTQAPIPSFPDISSEEASVSTSDDVLWITITVTVAASESPWFPDSPAEPSFTELPEPSFSFPPPPVWSTDAWSDEVGTTGWPADVSTYKAASASTTGTASTSDVRVIPGPASLPGLSSSSVKAPCPWVTSSPASDTSSLPLSSLTEVPFFSDVPEASGVPDWPSPDWPPEESSSDWFPDTPDFTSSEPPNWSSKLATILPIPDEFSPAETEVPSSLTLSSDFPRVSHDPSFSTAVSRTDFPIERRRASAPAPTEASSHSGPRHLARCECGQMYFGSSCSDSLVEFHVSGARMCRNRGSRMRPSQAMFRCECDEQTGEQSLELMSMASY